MRKRLTRDASPIDPAWLDLPTLAQVEITSETPGYPIEAALLARPSSGWRAAEPGAQTIRLLFDEARSIKRIQLLFEEHQHTRTQEFVLRVSDSSGSSTEVVRQQYNFSPPATACEFEDYRLDLDAIRMLELVIIPDISGGPVHASLARLSVA